MTCQRARELESQPIREPAQFYKVKCFRISENLYTCNKNLIQNKKNNTHP